MNVMQQLGQVYRMAQSQGPSALMVRLFWSSPIFGRKMLRKSPKCQGPSQSKSDPSINVVSRRNHLLYHFSIIIHLHLASFYATKSKKLATLRKMLIEHIIRLELRVLGPWPFVCSTTDYFYDKTTISKQSSRVDYHLLLKYCRKQCTLLSLLGPNHLQNSTPKCKILNAF